MQHGVLIVQGLVLPYLFIEFLDICIVTFDVHCIVPHKYTVSVLRANNYTIYPWGMVK